MNPKASSRSALAATAVLAALLLPASLMAQAPRVRKLGTPTFASRGRQVMAYRRSPAFAQRQAAYAQTWTNPSTTIRYSDGSVMKVTMKKNLPIQEGETHISRNPGKTQSSAAPEGYQWTTATTQVNLTATSNSFLNNDYGNSNSHLYPGAIFTFDNFAHGQYREQDGARNTMRLVTDNPNITGDAFVDVQDPSVGTTRTAIAAIYRRFTRDVGTESSAYDVVQSDNSASMNLQLSGGASGYGLSFSDAFRHQETDRTVSFTIDARKSLYSISALPPAAGFFKDPNVERTPNLIFISNVVYGVRVLANAAIEFKTVSDANDFKAVYQGGVISADLAINYMQSHSSTISTVHAYIVGGPGNSDVSYSIDELKGQIKAVIGGVNYQTARPISYQLSDMAGDIVGAQSATDTFNEVTSVPSGQASHVKSVRLHFDEGGDGKDDNTRVIVYVYPGQGPANGTNGAAFVFDDQGTAYPDNGSVDRFMRIQGTPDAATFVKAGGGHVHLDTFRHGGSHNDDWRVGNMSLILIYDDGTSATINLGGFTSTKSSGANEFFFGANLQKQ